MFTQSSCRRFEIASSEVQKKASCKLEQRLQLCSVKIEIKIELAGEDFENRTAVIKKSVVAKLEQPTSTLVVQDS